MSCLPLGVSHKPFITAFHVSCDGISAHPFYAKFTDQDQPPSGGEGEDDDAEAALKKEVGDIKASTEMRLRRFQSVESGANNVVFIRTLGIGVSGHYALPCSILYCLATSLSQNTSSLTRSHHQAYRRQNGVGDTAWAQE